MIKNQRINQRNFIRQLIPHLIGIAVGVYGFFTIFSTLVSQFRVHRFLILSNMVIDIHIIFGLGFVYLSTLLARRKRNAMLATLVAFSLFSIDGLFELLHHARYGHTSFLLLTHTLLPILIILSLVASRNLFRVRSDFVTFRNSLKIALIVLVITLAYGVSGFMLMDKSDFHQEIGFGSALHSTIDQFGLTINHPLHPYTKRANIFLDSLTVISIAAVVYLVISLFKPVKALLAENDNLDKIKLIMEKYGAPSEDFFKLWPKDKLYFFSDDQQAALAYQVRRGVALILADPVGKKSSYSQLFSSFHELCWVNDWQPSIIHISGQFLDFYKDSGYQAQLIGQEAILNISKFVDETLSNKYFRNICNRFDKSSYTAELLTPPHHQDVVKRLQVISNQWLDKPGRTERGFVMGYFNESYIQMSKVIVVRDAAQTIQGFMNVVPSNDFNQTEATYDMLRSAQDAPPNINDFMLIELIKNLKKQGYEQLNLGLCPLVGLDDEDNANSLINSVLRFAYVNGDRIYSFSGLHRFKDKYQPNWEDRYLVYKGGVRGFSKMLNSLVIAMSLRFTLKRQPDRRTH